MKKELLMAVIAVASATFTGCAAGPGHPHPCMQLPDEPRKGFIRQMAGESKRESIRQPVAPSDSNRSYQRWLNSSPNCRSRQERVCVERPRLEPKEPRRPRSLIRNVAASPQPRLLPKGWAWLGEIYRADGGGVICTIYRVDSGGVICTVLCLSIPEFLFFSLLASFIDILLPVGRKGAGPVGCRNDRRGVASCVG